MLCTPQYCSSFFLECSRSERLAMAGRYTNAFAIEKRIGALCPYTEDKFWAPEGVQIGVATRKSLTPHRESPALPLRHFSNSFATVLRPKCGAGRAVAPKAGTPSGMLVKLLNSLDKFCAFPLLKVGSKWQKQKRRRGACGAFLCQKSQKVGWIQPATARTRLVNRATLREAAFLCKTPFWAPRMISG